jgi:diacylglycerol kinase (ATP)
MQPPRPEHDPADQIERTAWTYKRASLRWQRAQSWVLSLLRSFGYAFEGLGRLIRQQRNAQIHVILTTAIVIASWAWGLSRIEWLILVLTISLVLSMEALNTAIEAVVDLVSPQYHPLAKLAKDVAAGGVLITAIGAIVVALLLFGERIVQLTRTLLG